MLDEKRNVMQAAKALRDKRRKEAFISEQEHNEMIHQSQFLKAELHRTKLTLQRNRLMLQKQRFATITRQDNGMET